jgi:hypothetical protein
MADYLHNSIPGLRYGQKILPSEILGAEGSIFGNTYYVDSVNGSNLNPGTTPDKAFATVDYAIGIATANQGDVIFVREGHAETVTATSIAVDKAGVTIVCLGRGAARPTFTFSTADATITVSAANVT